MKANLNLLWSISLAIGITAFGFAIDRIMVTTFSRSYWQLPREQFFFFGWPIIALLLSAVSYKLRMKVLGTGLMIAGLGPVVGIAVWIFLWGSFIYSLGILLVVGAVSFFFKQYLIPIDRP